jgi:hypothetical protein
MRTGVRGFHFPNSLVRFVSGMDFKQPLYVARELLEWILMVDATAKVLPSAVRIFELLFPAPLQVGSILFSVEPGHLMMRLAFLRAEL